MSLHRPINTRDETIVKLLIQPATILSMKTIAEKLKLDKRTVKAHLRALQKKGVVNKSDGRWILCPQTAARYFPRLFLSLEPHILFTWYRDVVLLIHGISPHLMIDYARRNEELVDYTKIPDSDLTFSPTAGVEYFEVGLKYCGWSIFCFDLEMSSLKRHRKLSISRGAIDLVGVETLSKDPIKVYFRISDSMSFMVSRGPYYFRGGHPKRGWARYFS